MKIYCKCCDKVQTVRVDDCLNARTNEPYQDIACSVCDLVIASGTGIPAPKSLKGDAMNDRELLKMALETLERIAVLVPKDDPQASDAITALRKRLAQVEDDPDPLHLSRILHELAGAASMCWTPPPSGVFDSQEAIKHVESAIAEIRERLAQPEQEPLTDEQIDALSVDEQGLPNSHLEFARAIEAAHGIGEKK